MSSERDGSAIPDPPSLVATFTYDACARLTAVRGGEHHSTWLGGTTDGSVPPQAARAQGMPTAATPCLRHCFAFRLCGSEVQQQTLALERFGSAALIVAIESLRAYLTGAELGAAAVSAIGGIEVHAALDAGRVVCTAQLSDFQPGDLVVVEVDVAVYAVGREV